LYTYDTTYSTEDCSRFQGTTSATGCQLHSKIKINNSSYLSNYTGLRIFETKTGAMISYVIFDVEFEFGHRNILARQDFEIS